MWPEPRPLPVSPSGRTASTNGASGFAMLTDVHDRAEVLGLAVVDHDQRVAAEVDVLVLEVRQRQLGHQLRRLRARDVEHLHAGPAADERVVILEVHPGGVAGDVRQQVHVARRGQRRVCGQVGHDAGAAATATRRTPAAPQAASSLPPRQYSLPTHGLMPNFDLIDAYWRAANYLSVGQIYLLDNPLLREPLQPEHVKPRLLGHWGTTPGPELRLRAPEPRDPRSATSTRSTSSGPGHGGPGLVANAYLEGTYSEVYPHDRPGRGRACARLFRQFSFPGGIPSHVAPETPGLDPRGRRARLRARRTPTAPRSTTPTCSSACVVGDGEAETGPLAASWHSNKFLDPARDGAVLPILHLNGYKIANPTVLARIPREELERAAARATATTPYFVEGDDPAAMHQQMAATLDDGARRDRARSSARRARAAAHRAAALADDRAAHAEGLDRPEGGRRPAGRGHVARAPGAARRASRDEPGAPARSSRSGCAATGPRSCSTTTARCVPELAALAPDGRPADERQPARQRRPAAARPARCPTSATTPSTSPAPGADAQRGDPRARRVPARRRSRATPTASASSGPDETASNRLGAVFEATDRAWDGRAPARPTTTSRPTAG